MVKSRHASNPGSSGPVHAYMVIWTSAYLSLHDDLYHLQLTGNSSKNITPLVHRYVSHLFKRWIKWMICVSLCYYSLL